MTTTTPAKTATVCDCCKNPNASRLQHGGLTLKRDALDWNNAPCADASVHLDLCDACLEAVADKVNEVGAARAPRTYPDGDMICAVFHDFIDLQASPVGFGHTAEEALKNLHLVAAA